MKLLLVLGLVCAAWATPSKIESKVLQDLGKSPLINVLVTFKGANPSAARARMAQLNLLTREARLNTFHAVMKDHADLVQEEVTSFLTKQRTTKSHLDLRQIWISAQLIIRNIDRETLEQLARLESVESIRAETFIELDPTETHEVNADEISPNAQWGVDRIRAEAVWSTGNRGEGTVLANIDTGVRHTHVSLKDNYRGTLEGTNNYNWYAPTGQSAAPSDTNGHGTHTMGTIAGTANGIGVAPGATWIACRGCASGSCSRFDLTECGQWITCPTTTSGGTPNCGKAPHAVGNSWGSSAGGDTWYDEILSGWRTAGIVPLFSGGNNGPQCNTAGSPGDRPGAISMGSITSSNTMSSFSSAGPASDGRMKPNACAPGSDVISASHTSDTGYTSKSGTSMACPHAVGLTGLILKAHPNLTVNQIQERLEKNAVPITSSRGSCNGVPDTEYPNYHAGAGRIDAVNSVA